ncbi:hypothetical protein ACOMHN_016261 [Nucella lapillus]
MGSGFSGCTSPSSVGVTETRRSSRQLTLHKNGGVLSDSCDSGISINESRRKSESRHHVTSQEMDSEEEEEMVEGNDVACGTDFVMTSTPRPSSPSRVFSAGRALELSFGKQDSRNAHHQHHEKSLRHNRHSSPNLLDHAIHEEDEESHEGEPEDKRLRAQRPQRPKSAHFRKSRAQTHRSRTGRSRQHQPSAGGSVSGEESSADLTSDDGEEDFGSGMLTIPDETHRQGSGANNTLTTIKLGPQFQAQTKISDNNRHHGDDRHHNHHDPEDWWMEEQGSGSARTVDGGRDSCHSGASSVTLTPSTWGWSESRVAKKASERSISSILLSTAMDLDSSSASAASTNPACFAVTNPDITQHILKTRHAADPGIDIYFNRCLQEIEQDLRASTLAMCAKAEVTKEDYGHVVTSLRPRFLRLLGDFKMASGEVLGRLPVECQQIVQLEEHLAQRLLDLHSPPTPLPSGGGGSGNGGRGRGSPSSDLAPLITSHLQDLEELCDREGSLLPPRSLRPLPHPPSSSYSSSSSSSSAHHQQQHRRRESGKQQAGGLWDESGVEDESDSTVEEDLHGGGDLAGASGRSRVNSSGRHDGHVIKEAAALTSLPPKGANKASGVGSSVGSMKSSSSRARSSASRSHTDTSALPGVKATPTVGQNEGNTTNTTPTSAKPTSTSSSRCSTSKGGRKSRPDSGIVVSSCSASYSSSEATRETDADLATQTEWISTSLEMLEQILLVRTETHETVKSLVDAITQGSTSEQLKAHALYRWLASQSLPYYAKCKSAKSSSPTGKLRQLSEGKLCYATLYQELARAVGLKCERIEGYAKGPDYRPGTPIGSGSSSHYRHSWNAVLLGGHYHFLDAGFGALHCKFFVEHFFMTPPDEMRLSHFPRDKRWLLMTQSLSMVDFEGTLKTWPTMFAFNIRPLNMKSVLRSYDGRLSITVLLRNVAVTPQLEYVGPGTPQDTDALVFNIDQEIRNMDNAETFHLNLPEEGTYYFTLMVHDLEEDEDIPAFQYRVEYSDELL